MTTPDSVATPAQLVGALLRQHRKAQGLTLQQVAERVGVSFSVISDAEKGRKDIGLARLTRHAEALGLHVELVPGDTFSAKSLAQGLT